MSTDAATHTSKLTDLEILYRWVGKQIASGRSDMPLDEALERFRGYFEDLQGVRAEIEKTMQSPDFDNPLSADDAFREIHRRIDERAPEAG